MASQSAWCTVDSHTFGKIFHILTIQLQQLSLVLSDAVHGILDKFRCDIPLFVKDFFVIARYVLNYSKHTLRVTFVSLAAGCLSEVRQPVQTLRCSWSIHCTLCYTILSYCTVWYVRCRAIPRPTCGCLSPVPKHGLSVSFPLLRFSRTMMFCRTT